MRLLKNLKANLERNAKKAVKVVTKAHMEKICHIQKKMAALEKKIQKTKLKLAKAPKPHKIALQAEVKKMKAELKIHKKKLRTVLSKVATVISQAKEAPSSDKIKIEKKQKALETKADKIRAKMEKSKKEFLLLKLQYSKECKQKVDKERQLAKVYVSDIESKLKLVNERANKFKKSIEMVNNELKLREKVEKMALKVNTANSSEKRKRIEGCIKEAIEAADKLKKEQEIIQQEAEELHKEYEKKTEDVLEKERTAALNEQKELKGKLKIASINVYKLTKAAATAEDKRVRAALMDQENKARLKYAKLKAKISLIADKAKILKQEIDLRKEAITTEQKGAKLKAIMMEKAEQDRMTKIKTEWEKEVEKDIIENIKAMEAMYKKKIASIKKEIVQAQINKANYAQISKNDFKREKKLK